jgi:hypothetical protein
MLPTPYFGTWGVEPQEGVILFFWPNQKSYKMARAIRVGNHILRSGGWRISYVSCPWLDHHGYFPCLLFSSLPELALCRFHVNFRIVKSGGCD